MSKMYATIKIASFSIFWKEKIMRKKIRLIAHLERFLRSISDIFLALRNQGARKQTKNYLGLSFNYTIIEKDHNTKFPVICLLNSHPKIKSQNVVPKNRWTSLMYSPKISIPYIHIIIPVEIKSGIRVSSSWGFQHYLEQQEGGK